MLSTPHLLVGAAIIKAVPEPTISLPLALLSHFVLDSIPHWDGSPQAPFSLKASSAIIIDYAFGASLVLLFSVGFENQYLIWLGAFLGTLPDFLLGTYKHLESFFSRWSFIRIPNEFHMSIQRNIPFKEGLVVSTLTSLLAIFVLLN
ncbi:MAG TPA: hypothetical protein VIH52_03660 [Candidatus Nanoarchaeia archaeon]|nr:hypothetical protein [uncultured archaeon]